VFETNKFFSVTMNFRSRFWGLFSSASHPLLFNKYFPRPKRNFQTAAKAVELKNLIDHAHQYLPKVGRCLPLELEFRHNHIYPEEEADEDYDYTSYNGDGDGKEGEKQITKWKLQTKERTFEKLQYKLAKIYDLEGFRMEKSGFEDSSINILGEEIQSLRDISLDDVKKWYAAGTDSEFGNVLKQETQHNAHVRSSRELDTTQFTVSQKILDEISLKWGEKFVPESVNLCTDSETLSKWGQKFAPESVTAQPYKIVIYGPGDHFQFHKDTPEENLCGTFLISLYEHCDPSYSFEIRQHGESFTWSCYENNGWCAFYPDIPHRVRPLESGYRAILSFKIYAKNQECPQEWGTNVVAKMQMEKFVEELQNLDVPVGIVLDHHYGYDTKSFYGCDKLLLDALKRKGLEVNLKPVLIRFSGRGPYPNDSYYSRCRGSVNSGVYSITDEALDYVRKRLSGIGEEEKFGESSKEIVFLGGEAKKHEGLWDMNEEEECDYTGNASRPHSEDSVYVRYAAILQRAEAASKD
jgi:hypothetical protein